MTLNNSTPINTTTPSVATWAILFLIVLIGAMLRWTNLFHHSLWQDEIYSLASATGNPVFEETMGYDHRLNPENQNRLWDGDPPQPVLPKTYQERVTHDQGWDGFYTGLTRNIQGPLFPTLNRLFTLNGWADNPWDLRVLPVLAGFASILAAFWLGLGLRSHRLGLLLAAIVSLSGYQVMYSQTARVYTLIMCLALLGMGAVARLTQPDQVRKPTVRFGLWVLLWLTMVLGFLGQYFFGFVILTQLIWLAFAARQAPQLRKPLAGLILATAVGIGLWIPSLMAQWSFVKAIGGGEVNSLWKPLPLIERLWNSLAEQVAPKDLPLKLLATLVIIVSLASTAWNHWKKKVTESNSPIRWLALGWLIAVVGGIVLLDIIGDTHRALTSRYLILAAPAVYLILADALLTFPGKPLIRRVLTGLVLIGLFINGLQVATGPKALAKENYRDAGKTIQAGWQPGDLVLVNHSHVHAIGMSYYLPPDTPMIGVSRFNQNGEWQQGLLEKRLAQLTRNYSGVWLVLTHSPPKLKTRLLAWFDEHYQKQRQKKFSSVSVVLLTRRANHD